MCVDSLLVSHTWRLVLPDNSFKLLYFLASRSQLKFFNSNSRKPKSFCAQKPVLLFHYIDQQFKPFLNKFSTQDEGEQVLDSLYEFRTPRNAILIIVSEFISSSRKRLHELNQKNPSQNVDLCLDSESIQVCYYVAFLSAHNFKFNVIHYSHILKMYSQTDRSKVRSSSVVNGSSYSATG